MADIQIIYNFGTYIYRTAPIYHASLVFAMCGNNKKKNMIGLKLILKVFEKWDLCQMVQDVQTSQTNIVCNSLECIAPSKSHGCMLS